METLKGVIFDRGTTKYNGEKFNKYLVAFVLITDEKIDDIVDGHETIITYGDKMHDSVTSVMKATNKYKPPHNLGELGYAMIQVSNMDPQHLEKLGD